MESGKTPKMSTDTQSSSLADRTAHIAGAVVPQMVSQPDSVTFYWVQEHEMAKLMTVERPFSLAISTTALGASLGLLPVVHDAYRAFQNPASVSASDMMWHVAYCVICAVCFSVFVVTGLDALRGRTDCQKLLREIKARPRRPLGAAG
jgi:hypothetical protein